MCQTVLILPYRSSSILKLSLLWGYCAQLPVQLEYHYCYNFLKLQANVTHDILHIDFGEVRCILLISGAI